MNQAEILHEIYGKLLVHETAIAVMFQMSSSKLSKEETQKLKTDIADKMKNKIHFISNKSTYQVYKGNPDILIQDLLQNF